MHKVTLIPGDGIGPEVMFAAKKIIDSTGVLIDWEIQNAGQDAINQYNDPLPAHVIDSIKKNTVALKGPVTISMVLQKDAGGVKHEIFLK